MEDRWLAGSTWRALCALVVATLVVSGSSPVRADGDLTKVNHIIIAMQENHSFDNYFGALPYGKKHAYHAGKVPKGGTIPICKPTDHHCVDALTCTVKKNVITSCSNSNVDRNGATISAFHQSTFCVGPDLAHQWADSHKEANFSNPSDTLASAPNDGFVRVNFESSEGQQSDKNDTMGYYTRDDLPFYYGLAETFAMNDSYHAPLIGGTFANRSFLLAGTAFGHLTTAELLAGPPGPYKPITGSIFDLLDANNISWATYSSGPVNYSLAFAPNSAQHQKLVADFETDAQNGTLPAVAFIDPAAFASLANYTINGVKYETDEHPPSDIRAGEYYIYQYVVSPLYNSPSWKDSILFFTYDEHGGYYDHATHPPAPQPDNIMPGQCADLSNPPSSLLPGHGFDCSHSQTEEAPEVCTGFTPTGPYPDSCPKYDQLGFRVPFVAISPFAKKKYVSHTIGDHTSVLALIEKRFLPAGTHLTNRDAAANTLEDMFDFKKSPSLKAKLPAAPPLPANDKGCPFSG